MTRLLCLGQAMIMTDEFQSVLSRGFTLSAFLVSVGIGAALLALMVWVERRATKQGVDTADD